MYKLRPDCDSDAGRYDALNYSYCSSASYHLAHGHRFRRAAIASQPRISTLNPRSRGSRRRDRRWH